MIDKAKQEVERYKSLLKNDITLLLYAMLEYQVGEKKANEVHKNDAEDLEACIDEAFGHALADIELVADDFEYNLPSLYED